MHIKDNVTHIDNEEDAIFLNTKLYPVNMRLFHSSERYKMTIKIICQHIADFCRIQMEGYKKPHGMSGANCGIPFNIIAYLKNRNQDNEEVVTMINPNIEMYDGALVEVESNCGSIRLEKPIKITRRERVLVSWYDLQGERHEEWFGREKGGFTIQHEYDHNVGILIFERKV